MPTRRTLKKNALNVRMYHVGFGDCFVLSFPVGGGHRHVLVDCGAHNQGSLGNLVEVAESVKALTGGRLAAVVATHRHQDHLWGFATAESVFRGMDIGEVWLPWVEDPEDDRARGLWKKHALALAALEQDVARALPGARRRAVEAVLANLKPNTVALNALRTHFGAAEPRVRYLAGGDAELVSPGGIEGLTVKVLGPPRDEDFLKKLNPPRAERWGAAAAALDGARPFDQPFDARWECGADHLPEDLFGPAERRRFDRTMDDGLDLAFAMEDAVNNSSLALLFAFRGQGLLMPGDAQWGNWKFWLEQQVSDGVFEQVTLYKVGHHGSHNATPRSVIDRLPEDVAVLVPTYPEPFDTIPEPKLIDALERRSGHRVVRSDATSGALPRGFTRGQFWIDCSLRLR